MMTHKLFALFLSIYRRIAINYLVIMATELIIAFSEVGSQFT